MLKLAVCDDLPQARESLRRVLENHLAKAGYECEITEYTCGEPLAADYVDGGADFDLVFLDIFIGELDGMQTARTIRAHSADVPIIFLTTSPDFALESYEVRAMGYLLKPLVPEKVAGLLDYFLQEEYTGAQKFLLLREGAQVARLPLREISYIASDNTVLLVHTTAGEIHRIYRKLGDVEEELCGFGFLRCHQSFLVNLAHITAAEQGVFVLPFGTRVPIRRQDAKRMRQIYFQHLLRKAREI